MRNPSVIGLRDCGITPVNLIASLRRLTLPLALCIALTGCTREHYRTRADQRTYEILNQKNSDPRWQVPKVDITPSKDSRFYDSHDLDNPPLPPDDPTAGQFMEEVYGIKGPSAWDNLDRLTHVENPNWTVALGGEPFDGTSDSLPVIENLTLEDSIELGMRNSRDYQEQIENMYLAALSLTFERYKFDTRFGGVLSEPGTAMQYENRPGDFSAWELGPTHLGISRLMPSGAQFAAELANNTLWMLSGGASTQTATTLAYSLTQPLYLAIQRAVTLEKLTQSERNVLYAMRDFARFRKDFYVTVVTGSRAYPLPGSTGRGELAFLIRGERSPTVGFYYLLYELQRLRNQESNVQSLRGLIRDLEALGEAGRATSLDITQLQSSHEQAKRYLAYRNRVFFNELDRFKVQLGLPPDIELTIDDTLLQPFEFLDKDLLEMQTQTTTVVLSESPTVIQTALDALQELQDKLESKTASLEGELADLDKVLPERLELMPQTEQEELLDFVNRDSVQLSDVKLRVAELSEILAELRESASGIDGNDQEAVKELLAKVRDQRRFMLQTMRELTGLGVVIRLEQVTLIPVDLDQKKVVDLAMENRLDLMNRRGIVTDVRRRLEVAAEQLLSDVNLVAEGEVATQDPSINSNPLDLRRSESSFRAGISIVTPLDRVRQRNNYRAAQVGYQRARRNFMAAEDQVKLDVRRYLRHLEIERRLFEINRRALRVAARELDQAIEFGDRPDAESRPGGRGVNISRALDNIVYTQNELIESWVDYETARMALYRDMGLMEIDENGRWR